jgi:hypothetical protein
LHTRPRPQATASSVGDSTTAAGHCDCDMHDHRTRVALVRNMDCQRPTPPPTTRAQYRSPTVTRRQRTRARSAAGHTQTRAINRKEQSHALLRSHTSITARRGAAARTRQREFAIAILRHSTLVTALDTAPAMHTQDAHWTARLCRSQRTPHAHAKQRRAPRHHHTAHTRARRHTQRDNSPTSPTQHNGTSPSWHVSPKTAHANQPRTAHLTLQRSIQHASPVHPQDVPDSHNNTALRKHHCTQAAARAPHTARYTTPRTPHTAHAQPPRHTHVRAVRLLSVDGMLPESWSLNKTNTLQDTSAIASRQGNRRRR